MDTDKYPKGLFAKKPHEKAPQFIKGKLSVKRDEFINWLQTQDTEWVNFDVKEGQDGKYYVQVDTWKPNNNGLFQTQADDIKTLRDNHNGKKDEEDSIAESDIPF